jgi:hypothetical protein
MRGGFYSEGFKKEGCNVEENLLKLKTDRLFKEKSFLDNQNIIIGAVNKWGKNLQFIVTIEELMELGKVLTKELRSDPVSNIDKINSVDNIIEEMADIIVSFYSVMFILQSNFDRNNGCINHDYIHNKINDKIKEKLVRLEERVNQ